MKTTTEHPTYKHRFIIIFLGLTALLFAGFLFGSGSAEAAETTTQAMYRLYNPNSGEHFYTASSAEKDSLVNVGWNYEGIGWTAPVTSNTPVYRMYNSNPSPKTGSGEHHYTTSSTERDSLIAAGWEYEGIGWYSDDAKSVPLYRVYNPNEFNNNHHYTTSKDEHNNLVSLGWKDEGTAWYGVNHTHNWVYHEATYKTVHHDAVYETIHHDAIKEYRLVCNGCGIIHSTQAENEKHAYETMLAGDPSHTSHSEKVVVSAAYDEQVLVSAAYDEQVLSQDAYYSCSCGAIK